MIVMVLGLPGSGKSFFASRLAEQLHAAYISSDIIRKQMISKPVYSLEEKLMIYDQMQVELKTSLDHHENVVLDATFFLNRIRKSFMEYCRKHKKSVFLIEVLANQKTVKERLSKPRKHSDADYTVYQEVKAAFEPLEEDHLVLTSANDNIDKMMKEAMNYIQSTV